MAVKEPARLPVLLVDDYEDSRLMLRRLLEMNGYDVREAANGKEAVEMARHNCPDLILMDLNMPEMDGLSAAKQIRECKGLCERVPIVAITAHEVYGMKEAAIEAGFDAYVTKPIDFDHLERVLQRHLMK